MTPPALRRVRPRVELLKELCTSPNCYVGCYPTISKELWQPDLKWCVTHVIRTYILKDIAGDLAKSGARTTD